MSVYMCGSNLYSQANASGSSVVCCPTLLQDMEGVKDIVFTVPGLVCKVGEEWTTRGKNPMINQDFKQLSKLAVSDCGGRGIGISGDGREVLELSRTGRRNFVLSFTEKESEEEDRKRKFLKSNTGDKSKPLSTEFEWCGLFSNSEAIVIDKVGRLWLEATQRHTPTLYLFNSTLRYKRVSCGASHALALTTDGEVLSWGSGMRGELGNPQHPLLSHPTPVPLMGGVKIAKVSAGRWHSLALGVCGEVYVWGWNADGQLGLPFKASNRKPDEECNPNHCCTENCRSDKTDDDACSPNSDDVTVNVQTDPVMLDCFGESDVVDVAAGDRHSVFLLENGDVYTCGWNRYGQLGRGCSYNNKRGVGRVTNLPGKVRHIHAGSWYSCFLI